MMAWSTPGFCGLVALAISLSALRAMSDVEQAQPVRALVLPAVTVGLDKNTSVRFGGDEKRKDIPAPMLALIESFEGLQDIELLRTPEDGGIGSSPPSYIARLLFEPPRPGYKACANHYPMRLVRDDEHCPDLAAGEEPGRGWLNCHGAFYTHEKFGCPPRPAIPVAPATLPPPRCEFSPEVCAKEAPGGPVIIREFKAGEIDSLTANQAATKLQPQVIRTKPSQLEPRATQTVRGGLQAARPTLRPPTASRQLVDIPTAIRLPGVRLHVPTEISSNLLCQGSRCQWGNKSTPVTLPPPPVIPVRHVPCEYEHVSFFVSENRFCPKARNGDRPAPGNALYVSLTDENSTPALFYHRDDFDGLSFYERMIIGNSDDRYAMDEATIREKQAAETTAMLVLNDYIAPANSDSVELQDNPNRPRLCSSERFAGLPQPGHCSGVKIGDRLIATSAHCVRNSRQCAATSAVFGYGGSSTAASRKIPASSVYQCVSIVATRRPATFGERGADWTIMEVDRDIDAPSASLAGSDHVEPSLVTTIIGHPLGLPKVVTRLGVVQTKTTQYFITNSDTFVGNSGSAVFTAQSVEDSSPRVLGLLTGGQYDFEPSNEGGVKCLKAKWCRDPDCLGDDVVYTDDLIDAMSQYSSGI